MRTLIFLGGIPGSGKTTLGRILQVRTGALHASAGDLIRRAKSRNISAERVRVEDANDARANQELLISEFRTVAASNERVVLDGHFIVPSEAGPIPVESNVFAELGIQMLAVLVAQPEEVARRLLQRTEPARWWDGGVDSLECLQASEIQVARQVSRDLSLPLMELELTAEEQLLAALGSAGT